MRRLAGLLIAVTCGKLDLGYIDKCFDEEFVPTPLAPAEAMWLAKLQLTPRAQTWATAASAAADREREQADAMQRDIEREVLTAARAPFAQFEAELRA